ncbi:MAG: segregation and condensation protein A [Cycloclasticus sp. symbiont of Bathymodiolus heckerae]|nr:MAG: segregation and condensation protein A [Cycloclasticus sp. symbiont of Bathymodiolus heckerae]
MANTLNKPAPIQQSLVLVDGKPFQELPEDLYIPPDALEVFLETFEGPLDLLLYLIKHQNLDILDIPVLKITQQYIEYIDLMQNLRMELAAEYLVMAAMLAEIKSKMLLPKQADVLEDEEDPRSELVRRLQEYERFKRAADDIDALPRLYRDNYLATAELIVDKMEKPQPDVELDAILVAFQDVLRRAEKFSHHHVQREPLSVRERMSNILGTLSGSTEEFIVFQRFFTLEEGRRGVVVTFLAILELCKEGLIEVVQGEPSSEIWLKPINE